MSEVAKSQATGGPRDRRKGSVRTRGSQHSALLKDGPAPPDKTAYEEKIKELTSHIEEKEKQIKHAPTDNADLSAQMRSKGEEMDGVEADRLKVNQEVRKVEQNIKRLGDEVAKEKESANRLAVELRFRSESTYDQHIAKLQRQVQAGDFLRPDDRVKVKLEAEIEKLKRCKVRLREYLTAKLKIDSKVNDQDTLRKKRDFLYCEEKKLKERKVKLRDAQEELRQKMEDRKGKQKEFKAQQAELRHEINELYKQRKELRESFAQEQMQYTETLHKARQAFYEQRKADRRKDIERNIAWEARKKEREAEKEMKREQEFNLERTICRALISFLKNVTPAMDEISVEGSSEGASVSVVQTSPPTKRAEEEWVPAGGKRKSKRDKKRSSAKVQHKNLHLNPTILYQFTQLRMSPPFSVSQIPTVLEELNCKLRMCEATIRSGTTEHTIKLTKESQRVTEYFCQVFYHKIEINCWKATLAFFPKEQLCNVRQFYHNASHGPTINLQFEVMTSSFSLHLIGVRAESWTCTSEQLNDQVMRQDILSYNGKGEPLTREVTFRAVSDTPPHLKCIIVLDGIEIPGNRIQIERMAEPPAVNTPETDGNGQQLEVAKLILSSTAELTAVFKTCGHAPDCMCQVFYYKMELNCWRIVFAFFPKDQIDNVKQFYHQDADYGPSVDHLVFQHEVVEIFNPQILGWTVVNEHLSVSRAAVEQYNGEGEPPYCEMTLRAEGMKKFLGDLHFTANLKGIKTSPIILNRPYEQPSPSADTTAQPQNSTDGMKCVCQVFYHRQGFNRWRTTLAFCTTDYLDKMKVFYQDATIGLCVDVQFMDTPIKVYSGKVMTEGWEVICDWQHTEVTSAAVEQYTGYGYPPYCEMTLRATDSDSIPPDLTLPVTLTGVRKPITITLERAAERPRSFSKQETGFLRGVDVHGEIVLEVVGDKPQKLEWPGYGFYIEVPEGALPPEVTAIVGVKVILGGQFIFPENRRLISAIYAVTSSEVFLKDVAVNMQHCAAIKTEEQCSTCRFIIAKCTQEVLPYRFREREGVFNPHTQYGAVKLKNFSLIGETASADTDLKCTALMFYKKQISSPLVVDFHFVVVKDLESYLQRVINDYQMQGWRKDESNSFTIFISSNTTIQLDLEEQEIDPWKILPMVSPPQVSSDDVSKFEAGKRIPHCSYELQLLPGKTFQRLLHKVALIGVSSPNSFHIRYPPQPEENRLHHLSTPTSPPASPQDEISNTLDISNIHKVKLALRNVSDNWQNLGLALGLSYHTLKGIRTSERDKVDQCIREMIAAWLAKKDNVSRIGTPSWSVLQAALREIGENEVADHVRLRDQFPSSSSSNSQSMDN